MWYNFKYATLKIYHVYIKNHKENLMHKCLSIWVWTDYAIWQMFNSISQENFFPWLQGKQFLSLCKQTSHPYAMYAYTEKEIHKKTISSGKKITNHAHLHRLFIIFPRTYYFTDTSFCPIFICFLPLETEFLQLRLWQPLFGISHYELLCLHASRDQSTSPTQGIRVQVQSLSLRDNSNKTATSITR